MTYELVRLLRIVRFRRESVVYFPDYFLFLFWFFGSSYVRLQHLLCDHGLDFFFFTRVNARQHTHYDRVLDEKF